MKINDFKPETRDLLNSLIAAGYMPTKGDNGEEKFAYNNENQVGFIDNLTACDESRLYVRCPDGKVRWLYLVLGNSPGELVCDYLVDAGLDSVTDAHYEKWSEIEQPTLEV